MWRSLAIATGFLAIAYADSALARNFQDEQARLELQQAATNTYEPPVVQSGDAPDPCRDEVRSGYATTIGNGLGSRPMNRSTAGCNDQDTVLAAASNTGPTATDDTVPTTNTGPTTNNTGPTATDTVPTTNTGPTTTDTGPTATDTVPTTNTGPTDTDTGPTATDTVPTTNTGPTDTDDHPARQNKLAASLNRTAHVRDCEQRNYTFRSAQESGKEVAEDYLKGCEDVIDMAGDSKTDVKVKLDETVDPTMRQEDREISKSRGTTIGQ